MLVLQRINKLLNNDEQYINGLKEFKMNNENDDPFK